jgi:hypothetical protein
MVSLAMLMPALAWSLSSIGNVRATQAKPRQREIPVTKLFTPFLFFVGEEAEELFETNWELEVDNFDDMGLKEEVLRGIYAFGFKEPSPIQQKGILPII